MSNFNPNEDLETFRKNLQQKFDLNKVWVIRYYLKSLRNNNSRDFKELELTNFPKSILLHHETSCWFNWIEAEFKVYI